MVLSVVLALLLLPKTGLIVLLIPALLFPCLFVLPDFLFPTRTKIIISEDGIDYEDFSQIIHAPWDSIRGLGEEPFFRFTRIVVDHPLANFCLSPHHPHADALKAAVEQRLFGATKPDSSGGASAPGQANNTSIP
ncbi:MAG: hypothetical protein A3K19_04210 [Lentisphaerae bacterium RIFOXYB12_FULL_65_16]|nr:MAG: hypothetical protein A3K18_09490 [Lentisphaerae bacterium RIFOXYA12_64_32]OGV84287.1 MAG: hypothetical protein A3K19_04210 [Lentisphaerae bacterium RIFOXYB12_FULL_65_16]